LTGRRRQRHPRGFIDDCEQPWRHRLQRESDRTPLTPQARRSHPNPGGPTSTASDRHRPRCRPTSTPRSARHRPPWPDVDERDRPAETGHHDRCVPLARDRRSTAGGGGSCPNKVTIEGAHRAIKPTRQRLDAASAQNTKVHQQGPSPSRRCQLAKNTCSCGSSDVQRPDREQGRSVETTTAARRRSTRTALPPAIDREQHLQLHLRRTAATVSGAAVTVLRHEQSRTGRSPARRTRYGSGRVDRSVISEVLHRNTSIKPCPRCRRLRVNQNRPLLGWSARGAGRETGTGRARQSGNTSFDCPPNQGANIGNEHRAQSGTTGTEQVQPKSLRARSRSTLQGVFSARAANSETPASTGSDRPERHRRHVRGGAVRSVLLDSKIPRLYARTPTAPGRGNCQGTPCGTPVHPTDERELRHHELQLTST